MSSPPSAIENIISKPKISFIESQELELFSNNKPFILKISYDENKIYFEIEEKNSFPKKEYILNKSLEALMKLDKYFLLFEKNEEVFNSFKKLFFDKNISLIEDEKQMKIQIHNSITNKEFFINVPNKLKLKPEEFGDIYEHISILERKIDTLEKKVKEVVLDNKKLKEKNTEYEKIIKENTFRIDKLEQLINNNINNKVDISSLEKSVIAKKEDINLILSWISYKPKSFELIFDSKKYEDSTDVLYNKCYNKKPLIFLIQSTDGFKFGGFSNIFLTETSNHFINDKESFVFSLDKKLKYKIKKAEKALFFQKNYGFGFGENDIFIYNNWKNKRNYTWSRGSYDAESQLNGGNSQFSILNFEVYHLEI